MRDLIFDRAFKLFILIGIPLLGWLYFLQHSGERIGRTEIIVPFKVEKAPVDVLKAQSTTSVVSVKWEDAPVTVVNFWATWCKPCVEEMPAMSELASRFDKSKLRFIFISVDDNWEKVNSFLSENVIDIPSENIFLDSSRSIAQQWGAIKFPETYIVNNKGWIVEKIIGFQEWSRPVVVDYFKRLESKFSTAFNPSSLLNSIFPVAYADETKASSGNVPLIHEDDKKNLEKLQKNVDTANTNVIKIEAAIKEEERSLREVKINVERQEKSKNEVVEQLNKVKDSLNEVNKVRKKNDDSLKSEKSEKERVVKELETLQEKLKDLEKEMAKTRDDIVVTNQRVSTRLQNIESFEKALSSSSEELKSLKEREKKLTKAVEKENDQIGEMQRDLSRRNSRSSGFAKDLAKWNETLNKEKQKLVEFEKLLK